MAFTSVEKKEIREVILPEAKYLTRLCEPDDHYIPVLSSCRRVLRGGYGPRDERLLRRFVDRDRVMRRREMVKFFKEKHNRFDWDLVQEKIAAFVRG